MSRAFVKEDAPVAPLLVPRAPLPAGATNYVTPNGLQALRDEHERLQSQREELVLGLDASERAVAHATLSGRIAELEGRLGSAVLVDPALQPRDEIRFGATVSVRTESGEVRRYRIVGVDEANASSGTIAFVAPLARALLGKRAGESAVVRNPRGDDELEIVEIAYE